MVGFRPVGLECDGLAPSLDGLGYSTGSPEGRGEVDPGGKEFGVCGDRRLTVRDGGFEPAQLAQRAAEATMRQRIIRFQRDRSPKAFDRLFALAGKAQRVAKVDVNLG